MAHWRNGSVITGLRHFARYGIRAASDRMPNGPIQRMERLQARIFPSHVKKEIEKIEGPGRLTVEDSL